MFLLYEKPFEDFVLEKTLCRLNDSLFKFIIIHLQKDQSELENGTHFTLYGGNI